MKSLMIGWEAASLQNGTVQSLFQAPADMILRGYHLDLAFVPTSVPAWGSPNPPFAEVLFYGLWTPTKPAGWINGNAIAPYTTRSIIIRSGENSQAVGPAQSVVTDSTFAAAILKGWMPSAVNKSLDASGLALTIPTGNWIVFEADHMGWQVDLELQGVLFYD